MDIQFAAKKLLKIKLTKRQCQVLLFFLSEFLTTEYQQFKQQKIADVLGVKREEISKAVTCLSDLKIIEIKKVGKVNFYRFNPYFFKR